MPPDHTDDSEGSPSGHEYTQQEIGQMLHDMGMRQAKYEKKMMAQQHEQEAFARKQAITNRNIDDALTALAASRRATPAFQQIVAEATPPTRGWTIPPSITTKPVDFDPESHPKLAYGAPRFTGENAVKWIRKIQKYYNHSFTPVHERLYLTSFLFDDAAEDWLSYWEDNTTSKTWDGFLLAVKKRFDPDLYEDYVGRLATLRQSSTVEAYQAEFESMLQKAENVGDSTLTSLFIAGLKPSLKQELLTRRPATLQDAFALAQQLAVCQAATTTPYNPKPAWQNRGNRTPQHTDTAAKRDVQQEQRQPPREGQPPRDYPVVRISAAERAERTRQGLCWWCPEKYSRTHVCAKKFYALMGVDDEDDEFTPELETATEDEGENMAITGDVSRILVLCPKIKPRSIRLQGRINGSAVSILIDGGSTHNFIQPAVAEKLSLSVNAISPFRVFVGDGASLKCAFACLGTPITLQGHHFEIDLFVLQVKGPDIILGVQWLQDLGDITKNYRNLTMKFEWENQPVFLRGEDAPPRPISYNNLFSLIGTEPEADIFEVIPVQPGTEQQQPSELAETDPEIAAVLPEFATVFDLPAALPPARQWDHRIHLQPGTKPINVRPYRYPYFQKAEIERQIVEMLKQGVIQHSTSAFSSPVLLVRKKDGTFRFCVDYRALNAATTPDHFPIPTADELFDELHEARIFSKLDLRSGYHQIRMNVDDIHKTAFRTHEGHYEFLVMPFGLTNAPSTFQAAMNSLFQPFLRRFVIVFFDDILVYSSTSADHVQHLQQVLQILQDNTFFIKKSKCSFGVRTIEYLGHIISAGHLHADPAKLEAMRAWPTPTTVKQLRGFLGLTGYYRRFVKNYSIIASPLTDLLKKDAFSWTESAAASFTALKEAMCSAPVLRLPNFEVPFILETDASDLGIGAVLLQENHPLAYFSKKLGPRRRLASTYHKELYTIVEAVQKWRQYLLGREFIIRSDQRSLKDLLSQVVQTPDQQFYLRKLMGFKFRIEYKSGASNKVADALSRQVEDPHSGDPSLLVLLTRPNAAVMDSIKLENSTLEELQELHRAVAAGSAPAHVSAHDGLLYFKRRLFLARNSAAIPAILAECHSAPTAGHPGARRTLARVTATFYWAGMRSDINDYVAACEICQATKYVRDKPNGLIQPLPIPDMVWSAASMDFIVGLPKSQGYTAIMVVVDRLSKYAHFGALKPGFDAARVARLFVDTVVKLHGFPKKLLSDRDTIFMSNFWEEMISLSGTKLQFTTAYHPQTDGQSEVTNRALEQYLRAYTFDCPSRWSQMLPWAELALNCSVNVSIGMSPYEALYGREPPNLFDTYSRPSHNVEVADLLEERETLLRKLKTRIKHAQDLMATQANRHRKDVEFAIGDMVWLRLQPYRQHSVGRPISAKLGRRYYGPFAITERIGKVAYRLQLPVESRIHDVFHVSLLKPFISSSSFPTPRPLPSGLIQGHPLDTPVQATAERTVLVDGVPQLQWLIHWASDIMAAPSWEPAAKMVHDFPHLRLEDKAVSVREGVDRDPDTCTSPGDDKSLHETDEEEETSTKEEQTDNDREGQRPKRKRNPPDRYGDFIPY